MKILLTQEESQHLIDLGVPKENAAIKSLNTVFGTNTLSSEYPGFGAETISTDIVEYRFTLDDFLKGEILPKEIIVKGEIAELCFDWNSQIKRWCAAYSWLSEEYESHEEELIDALYNLTCWYYGEFLKSEKQYGTEIQK